MIKEAHIISGGQILEPPSDVAVKFVIKFDPVIKISNVHGYLYQLVKEGRACPADMTGKVKFMSGCFSFWLLSYILGIFSKTEQYFLQLDKLLPDSVMASSRSEENVVLNNFQHKRCISVGIPSLFYLGIFDNYLFFGRCYANFCYFFSLTDVIIKVYVVDLKTHFGRCYCPICVRWYYHNCCLLVVDIFCEWQMLLPYLLLVVDDKPLISVLWPMLLPWWLVLLPHSFKLFGWCYCHGSWCYCYIIYKLADVIAPI